MTYRLSICSMSELNHLRTINTTSRLYFDRQPRNKKKKRKKISKSDQIFNKHPNVINHQQSPSGYFSNSEAPGVQRLFHKSVANVDAERISVFHPQYALINQFKLPRRQPKANSIKRQHNYIRRANKSNRDGDTTLSSRGFCL